MSHKLLPPTLVAAINELDKEQLDYLANVIDEKLHVLSLNEEIAREEMEYEDEEDEEEDEEDEDEDEDDDEGEDDLVTVKQDELVNEIVEKVLSGVKDLLDK